MKSRTRARSLALQVLYEVDLSNHLPAEVLSIRLEDTPLTEELAEFARQIIFGVLPLTQELDNLIAKYAPEWPLDQIAAIDRNILRMAFWEFAVQRETPVKVAINEAVELAKQYGSDSAPRFVNGVLGSLAEHRGEIQKRVEHLETKNEWKF
jgi:N utilization substance protein B